MTYQKAVITSHPPKLATDADTEFAKTLSNTT
jgi:hypothetical protein